MAEIEVEMTYYAGDVKRLKGIDIKEEEVKKIGEKHGVNVTVTATMKQTAVPTKIFTITLAGDEESSMRRSIEEIVELYGKPDFPRFVSGSRKKGKQIAESIVKEKFR